MRTQWSSFASLACLLIGLAGAAAGPGYLPSLGPVALRFRVPASPSVIKTPLPPLVMTNAAPEPAPEETAASGAVSPVPTVPPVPFANEAANEAISREPLTIAQFPAEAATNLVHGLTSESEVVSPASILRFFQAKSTNGVSSAVVLPLGFTPAVPAPPLSSTATYSTSP